jgi:hypothetical protein
MAFSANAVNIGNGIILLELMIVKANLSSGINIF